MLRQGIVRLALVMAPRAAVTMTGVGYAVDYGSTFIDLRGKLPEREGTIYGTRNESAIQGVVIHHTATSGQTIRSIAQFHAETRGWPGIAYHYAIGYDGVVYRLQDVSKVTYHAKGYNYRTIGVALIGNFDEKEMPERMKGSLVKLLNHLKGERPLKYVCLHRQTKATACPGKYATSFASPHLFGSQHLDVRK